MQQAYRDQNSGALPPAALVKAALLNSAHDLGRPAVDFVHGYGQADALGAVRTVLGRRLLSGAVAGTAAGAVFAIVVPAGQQQLKATLVWADPEAAPNAARALVNDLDLELVLPWHRPALAALDAQRLPPRRLPGPARPAPAPTTSTTWSR